MIQSSSIQTDALYVPLITFVGICVCDWLSRHYLTLAMEGVEAFTVHWISYVQAKDGISSKKQLGGDQRWLWHTYNYQCRYVPVHHSYYHRVVADAADAAAAVHHWIIQLVDAVWWRRRRKRKLDLSTIPLGLTDKHTGSRKKRKKKKKTNFRFNRRRRWH
jgi:hypothetical protein